jgi:two-component system response regulator
MSVPEAVDILMVEDDPHDAELAMRALRRRHIANPMHVAQDGADALDFVFARGPYAERGSIARPKVILLDLKLPRVTGLEVLRALKADERTRTIPVVILTSSKEDPDMKAAYALGANSYVVKPMDIDAFTHAMSRVGLYWLLVNQPAP